MIKERWKIFLCSVFFVLGFAVIFSLVGVLLQTVLVQSSVSVQRWLGRVGGVIIILFGLYLVGLLHISFLERKHAFKVSQFHSAYLTSFLFGAAFAVGWTPCVTAALGAILALAASSPSSAFILLLSYTLGLGVPFLLVGLFTNGAQKFIAKAGNWIKYLQYIFGAFLIMLGILVFTNQLSKIANLESVASFLITLNVGTSAGSTIASLSVLNIIIAFAAGLISFLSPCILPLIPAFLSYLASITLKEHE
ncbi:MAG TPA: cytochrome c biogenesis protein CcdA [Candidatus Nanoarchaeia archaeon]|nr:cytochrome c biogenesis protein CcdA [Candidatus Nanoarchaeia archaeon]